MSPPNAVARLFILYCSFCMIVDDVHGWQVHGGVCPSGAGCLD